MSLGHSPPHFSQMKGLEREICGSIRSAMQRMTPRQLESSASVILARARCKLSPFKESFETRRNSLAIARLSFVNIRDSLSAVGAIYWQASHDFAEHSGKLRPSQILIPAHLIGDRSRDRLLIKHSFNDRAKPDI
ncbi:hypothetical protein [Collinsella sp. LCP19S3_B11]|uniref:hypothetical protein n=1 Tax=Collinsella sp. LCP19S3_B11 TaxID=3438754 RepID=UPI003F90ADA9